MEMFPCLLLHTLNQVVVVRWLIMAWAIENVWNWEYISGTVRHRSLNTIRFLCLKNWYRFCILVIFRKGKFSPMAGTLYWVQKFTRFNFAKHTSSGHGSSGQSVHDFSNSLHEHEVLKLSYQPVDAWTLALISHHLASSMAPLPDEF